MTPTFTQFDDWDAAYSNRAAEPDHQRIIDDWAHASSAYRESRVDARLDISYGVGPRERYDLFPALAPRKGVMIFIHGGYWRMFSKSWFAHLAQGPNARGWDVAIISYPLAPAAHLSRIAEAANRAIEAIARELSGKIVLVGYSAGAHLAALAMTMETGVSQTVQARVARLTLISGVFDLRPMRRLTLNDDLRLTAPEAAHLSPALLTPAETCETAVVVGADELPAFLMHSRCLADHWSLLGAKVAHHVIPEKKHFTIIGDLHSPISDLSQIAAP